MTKTVRAIVDYRLRFEMFDFGRFGFQHRASPPLISNNSAQGTWHFCHSDLFLKVELGIAADHTEISPGLIGVEALPT